MSGLLKRPKIGKDATMCMKSAFIIGPPCKLKNAMQMILIPEGMLTVSFIVPV